MQHLFVSFVVQVEKVIRAELFGLDLLFEAASANVEVGRFFRLVATHTTLQGVVA